MKADVPTVNTSGRMAGDSQSDTEPGQSYFANEAVHQTERLRWQCRIVQLDRTDPSPT